MYKLILPAIALLASFACANQDAADLREDAADLREEAATATEEAARATAEETKEDVAEWLEFEPEAWDSNWDTFADSTELNFEAAGYELKRDAETNTDNGSITVRRVTPVRPPVDAIQDAAILALVKAKLATDKDVRLRNIDIKVVNNVVYMSGALSSKAETREAVRLALNTKGVYDVVSHLTVQK